MDNLMIIEKDGSLTNFNFNRIENLVMAAYKDNTTITRAEAVKLENILNEVSNGLDLSDNKISIDTIENVIAKTLENYK